MNTNRLVKIPTGNKVSDSLTVGTAHPHIVMLKSEEKGEYNVQHLDKEGVELLHFMLGEWLEENK